jgi:hypothetical protein
MTYNITTVYKTVFCLGNVTCPAVGQYETIEEAIRARDLAVLAVFGSSHAPLHNPGAGYT